MAPIITDPKKLSMPQQVQKNKDDIAEIKKVIDGLDSLDNVVIVPDMSHIMTAEELKSVRQPVCFIVYNDHLYIKKKEESGNAYFDVVFSIHATTVISFQSSEIEVNLTNGALGITNSTVETYSKTTIDSLLTSKAAITYVDTELAKKADLTGANFSGAITSPSITEIMSGYSFNLDPLPQYALLNIAYAGVCKNGNKLSFALAGTVGRTGVVSGNNLLIGKFAIPAEIYNNIYPISGTSVAYLNLYCASDYESGVSCPIVISKVGNNTLGFRLYKVDSNLTENINYHIRCEFTFLLSDNLAN